MNGARRPADRFFGRRKHDGPPAAGSRRTAIHGTDDSGERREQIDMPNTRISYVCADGAGTRNAVVVPGTFAPEQIGRIIESLDRNIYFMPCKVGLPERGLDHGGPSGHGWFMLDAAGFEQTDEIGRAYGAVRELRGPMGIRRPARNLNAHEKNMCAGIEIPVRTCYNLLGKSIWMH